MLVALWVYAPGFAGCFLWCTVMHIFEGLGLLGLTCTRLTPIVALANCIL